MHYFSYDHETLIIHGGCSSVVEHSTADRNVLGSIPSVPFQPSFFINPLMHYFSYGHETLIMHRGCSSVVEHSTADRNVLGSIPSVPFQPSFFINPLMHYFSYGHETLIIHGGCSSVVEHSTADRNVLGSIPSVPFKPSKCPRVNPECPLPTVIFINPLMHYFSYGHETLIIHEGCSSVVEHSTADRNVLGSIPSVPFRPSFFINPLPSNRPHGRAFDCRSKCPQFNPECPFQPSFFHKSFMHYFSYDHETLIIHGGCSSVVEHSTADRNVLGSIPSVPFQPSFFINPLMHYFSYDHETLIIHGGCSSVVEHSTADRNVLGSIRVSPSNRHFLKSSHALLLLRP
ncbi:unnamed protein product [Acanthosepion pharaonis]|uniref:Uncharacterized protein n=1 Tax=Acanthosepion pharaonis TaxID=158019 RepID=A0A812D727_ACAPH|nr:unnamed protein product [Sepia pharaonis]